MHKEYFLDKESLSANTKDVFFNNFDITWAEPSFFSTDIPDWKVTDNKIFTKLPIEKIKDEQDDGSIVYKYNNDFFRCDDFTTNHNGLHILFAGCSQTEGVGGNIEDVWSNMLFNKIKKNNNTDGFYSIARAGYGWQKIISNCLIYIKKYGTPEYLFILLPNVGRMYEWDSDYRTWVYKQKYAEIFTESLKEKDEISFSEKDYMKSIIDFKNAWNLFEQFCETNKIKMLWSTWDELDHQNYKIIDSTTFDINKIGISKNYIDIANKDKMELYFMEYSKHNKIKKDDFSRRDDHFGTLYNRYWTDCFYKEIKRRWEI